MIALCFSLVAAVSYGIASMAMVFLNKAVLMQYSHSMTLLTLQVHFCNGIVVLSFGLSFPLLIDLYLCLS